MANPGPSRAELYILALAYNALRMISTRFRGNHHAANTAAAAASAIDAGVRAVTSFDVHFRWKNLATRLYPDAD